MKITLRDIRPGTNLAALLRSRRAELAMPCGGTGKCGRCKVLLCAGEFRLADGSTVTLQPRSAPVTAKSCSTLVLSGEMTIDLPPVPAVVTEGRFTPEWRPEEAVPGSVIAVDLGTTTIAAALISGGRVIAVSGIANPQRIYGDNVIDRIAAASASPEDRLALQDAIFSEALPELLKKLPFRELDPPRRMVISGNTAMSCLACGIDAETLGRTPFTAPVTDFPEKQLETGVCGAPLTAEFFPAAAGFLGGDTLAGLYACNMLDEGSDNRGGTELFVDLGTNCEIVLKKNGRFYGATAAAGPAFERHADTAASGIINRVKVVPGAVQYSTIGGAPASGICGAALLSLLSGFLKTGIIDRRGRFVPGALARMHLATSVNGRNACRITAEISVSEELIAELITAKAAVSAGIKTVLKKAGAEAGEISRTVLAGGFAAGISIADAVTTGLLPLPEQGTFVTPGNASLAGCARAAATGTPIKKFASFRERFTVINLAEEAEFNDIFIEEMTFPASAVN